MALTFDDGPSQYTAAVLRILGRNKAHATFFVIGRQVPDDEATVASVIAAGGTVGDHTEATPR